MELEKTITSFKTLVDVWGTSMETLTDILIEMSKSQLILEAKMKNFEEAVEKLKQHTEIAVK